MIISENINTPVQPSQQRWVWLDALRGFALLGILVVNVQQMFFIQAYADGPIAISPQESGVWAHWWLLNSLFELKFFTLFTFLFGFSFVLQKQSITAAGGKLGWVYSRRLILLSVFGVIHGVYFYYADVLFMYALAGFVLLACHNFPAERLFKVGLVLLAISVLLIFTLDALVLESKTTLLISVLGLAGMAILMRDKPIASFSAYLALLLMICLSLLYWHGEAELTTTEQFEQNQANAYEIYSVDRNNLTIDGRTFAWLPDAIGDISEKLTEEDNNLVELLIFRYGPQHLIESLRFDYFLGLSAIGFIIYFFWRIVGLFMLSAALATHGMHKITDKNWRYTRSICLAAGFILTLLASWMEATLIQNGGTSGPLVTLAHELSALLIAAAILAQFYLWRVNIPTLKVGTYLASGGRMALSNYIAQSAVMAVIAGPSGLQLFGRVSHWQAFALALVVFFVLIALSHLWLKYFRMGPLEWGWRCGTYLRWFPIVRPSLGLTPTQTP